MEQDRYWIAQFKKGGESAGNARHRRLDEARLKKQGAATYPNPTCDVV